MTTDTSTPRGFLALIDTWAHDEGSGPVVADPDEHVTACTGYGTDWAGDTAGGFRSEFDVELRISKTDTKDRTVEITGDAMASLWSYVVNAGPAPAAQTTAAEFDVLTEEHPDVDVVRDRAWLTGAGEDLGFAAGWPMNAAEFAARWNLWGAEYRDRHVRRYVEYASRHIRNLEETGGMVVEAGWICEVHRECTCGNGDAYPYGHEPGCGLVPITTVESALVSLATIGGMTSSTVWTASYTPADHPRRARTVEVHSAVSAEDALDRASQQPGAPGRNAIRVTEHVTRTVVTTNEVQA